MDEPETALEALSEAIETLAQTRERLERLRSVKARTETDTPVVGWSCKLPEAGK